MIRAALILLGLCIAQVATAQVPAILVADRIVVTPGGQLVAEGNVEVFHDGTRLTASRVTYDRSSDRLSIDGPILVVADDGSVISASQATLDPRLEAGMLLGARLVLNRQIQLAAGRIDRTEGRFSQLTEAAVTSCRVCAGQDPLWEIRAARVIHDEDEAQIYFEDAQFRIRGVPVLWLPRMRLPDGTLDRSTGFLTPSIRSTDQLGTGLVLPYFITLGDARDLTLTPYVSSQTRTLDLRYRQAFNNGAIVVAGAVTDDDLIPGELRGYATATGAFDLPRDYLLRFDLEGVSDRAYLLDYGLTDADFLASEVAVMRVRDQDYLRGGFTLFEGLREGDNNDLLPSLVGELHYERRFTPRLLGGTVTLRASADSLARVETADGIGRDMGRIGARLGWHGDWVTPNGMVAEVSAMAGLDVFGVDQDSSFDRNETRGEAGAALTLRWPLVGRTGSGATHLVEPMAQLAWSEASDVNLPNEDSTVAEFDEGNLLAVSRFAGEDRIETGLRGAVGVTWTRVGVEGWTSTLTFGRAFREDAEFAYSESSGLRGTRSDWLIAGQLDFGGNLSFGVRSLLNDGAEFTKTEARLEWTAEKVQLAAVYAFQPADADEGREDRLSEWTLDGAYQINETWALSGEARYDLVSDRPAKAALGVDWRSECVAVGLSVSRRFTSSGNVEPATDYGLSVELLGFSTNGDRAGPARSCRG